MAFQKRKTRGKCLVLMILGMCAMENLDVLEYSGIIMSNHIREKLVRSKMSWSRRGFERRSAITRLGRYITTKGARKGGVWVKTPPWTWYFTKTLLLSQGD